MNNKRRDLIKKMTVSQQFVTQAEDNAKMDKVRRYAPLILLVIMTAIGGISQKNFFSWANIVNIMFQMSIPLVISVGLSFVLLLGSIDLSIEGNMGFAGSLVAFLVVNNSNSNNFGIFGVLIAILIGLAVGTVVGFLHTKGRIASFIVSYAVFLIFIGVSLLIKNNVKFKPTCALVFSLIVISSAVSVYESSVNTYLDISSTNVVVIYNNSAAIVVDADNVSDYYKVKQCLSRSKSESVLFVNCNYDNEKLSSLAKNDKEFLNNYDFDIDLCEQVNVKYQSGVIFANVNNAQIEINKKYVVINKKLCYQRKTKYIYDNNDDTVISIRK